MAASRAPGKVSVDPSKPNHLERMDRHRRVATPETDLAAAAERGVPNLHLEQPVDPDPQLVAGRFEPIEMARAFDRKWRDGRQHARPGGVDRDQLHAWNHALPRPLVE